MEIGLEFNFKNRNFMKTLLIFILMLISCSSFAVDYQLLNLAQKTIKIAQTARTPNEIFSAERTWRSKFNTIEFNIKVMNGEEDSYLTKKAKEEAVDKILDQLKKQLPSELKIGIDFLSNNLAYKIFTNIFQANETAGPLKEAQLLNENVNDEILNGLIRIYPSNVGNILHKLPELIIIEN